MTILWDWNGTLLDDTRASVEALNDQLVRRGLKALSLDEYRETFAFPARDYYARVGIDLDREDWATLARDYHDAYHRRPAPLNGETLAALEAASALGARQVIVSALRQDYLDAAVDRFALRRFFARTVGTDNLDGASKLQRAETLLAELRREGDDFFVLIGDSLHDAEVAAKLGVRVVLFSGGGHAAHRLEPIAPTSGSLVECVRLAESLCRERKD